MELSYDLGLTTLRREYSYCMDSTLKTTTENAILAGTPRFDVSRGKPAEMYVYWEYAPEQYMNTACTLAEETAIWEAIQKDVAEGNYHATLQDEDVPRLEMSWREKRPDGSTTYYRHQNFYPSESCVHTYPLVVEVMAREELENTSGDPSISTVPAQEAKVDG